MKTNFKELGRSMVEMLGVLAVIGVLSIAGLQGYRKAMNKVHANELMDLAIKVYNEAVAKDTHAGGYTTITNNCRVYLRETAISASKNRGLGWEKPSWTTDNFTILASPCGVTDTSGKPAIIFYYSTEEDCNTLKGITEDLNTARWRLWPGSISPDNPNGIYVSCTTTGTTNNSNW